jgi:hypothetical protein
MAFAHRLRICLIVYITDAMFAAKTAGHLKPIAFLVFLLADIHARVSET